MSGSFFSLLPWLIFGKQRAFSPASLESTALHEIPLVDVKPKMASAIAGTWGGHIQIVKMQKWSEVHSKNQSILHHGQCSRAPSEKTKEIRKPVWQIVQSTCSYTTLSFCKAGNFQFLILALAACQTG